MTQPASPEDKLDPTAADSDMNVTDWINPSLFKTNTLVRILLVLGIIISLLWLGVWAWLAVSYFAGLLLLFMSAWLVALILSPLVRRLVWGGLPKGAAIALAYLLIFVLVGLFIALVVPGLVSQTTTLIGNFGSLTTDVQSWLNATAKNLGIGTLDLNELGRQLQSYATDLLKNALAIVTGLAGFVVQILLVTIISASLLAGQRFSDTEKEPRGFSRGLWQHVPQRWRNFGRWLKESLERNFGVFLGGQLIVGVLYGIAATVIMGVVGLPYAVTTGCICGAMMLIPFFGGPLSLLLPLLVALSTNPIVAWVVVPILFVIQTVLLNIVLPKIVGQSSGLGPVATLFVLLAGAQIGGVWGVLLGVPIVGVAVNTFEFLVKSVAKREPAEIKVEVSLPASKEAVNSTQVEVMVTNTPVSDAAKHP